MGSFEIRYPVVGAVRIAHPDDAVTVADTYFEPIMVAAFAIWRRHPAGDGRMPALLRAWQTQTGPFDVEGGVHAFDPDDGLVPLLRTLAAGPHRPVLDLSRLVAWDGATVAPVEEVLLAMIDIMDAAIALGARIEVEDIP